MKLFSVDYDVADAEKFKAQQAELYADLPAYVLAEDVISAVAIASSYEDANLKVRKCDLALYGKFAFGPKKTAPTLVSVEGALPTKRKRGKKNG